MADPAKRVGRYCGSKHDHPPHAWASHLVGAPPEGYPRDCPGKPRREPYALKTFGPPAPEAPVLFFIEDAAGNQLLEAQADDDWQAQGLRLKALVDAANRGTKA